MTRLGTFAAIPLAMLSTIPARADTGSVPARLQFDRLTRADGIPSGTVYQVLQDRQGFLWFSTRSGLNRYDGYQTVTSPGFPIDTDLANPAPGFLYEDRKGTFWVTTRVLSRFDPGNGAAVTRFTPQRRGTGGWPMKITAIHDDAGGLLWMGVSARRVTTDKSEPVLYRFDPNTGSSVAYDVPVGITKGHEGGIHAIEVDKAGMLWLGTTYGLIRFNPARREFVHFPHTHEEPTMRPENTFNALAWDRSGKLWVHMPAGLERFDPMTGTFDRFKAAKFLYMPMDARGMLWLYAGWEGLQVFDPQSDTLTALKHYAQSPSGAHTDELVFTLGTDREGNVWAYFNQAGSLHRYSPVHSRLGKFVPDPDDPNSLSGGLISGFLEDRDGSIWVSTARSGLDRFDPASGTFTGFWRPQDKPLSLPVKTIYTTYEDRAGMLWIGSAEGIGRFDRKTGRYTHLRGTISGHDITSMFEDRQGRFWVGASLGPMQLVDRQTGVVMPMKVNGGYAAHEDRYGNLWFAAYPEGLDKLDTAGNVRVISLGKTLAGAAVEGAVQAEAFYEDPDGFLWIGTSNGLFRFDPQSEKSTRYTTRNGLAEDEVRCLVPDGGGNIWLSTAKGISRLNLSENRFYNYDVEDGLQGTNFVQQACYRARDGRLYFGGFTGFNTFYPRDVLTALPEPPVALENLQIKDNKPQPLPYPVRQKDFRKLPYKQNGFSVEFAALSYASPWKTRYRFRLDDLEKDWTEADSAHRIARYTELPPGDYTLHVQESEDGVKWSPGEASLHLEIATPWWLSPWTRSAAVLALMSLLFAAYRFRVKALHDRERRLHAVVAERTAELVEARDHAEAANRSKSVFLANMSHELRTPLNAILGFSHLLREESVTTTQRKDLDTINRSGEHLLDLINDVLDMAKIEAGRETLEISPCEVGSLLRDVMEMMRVRAEEKGLELVFVSLAELPCYARADTSHLRQVLINLLANAIKFTAKGSVTLRLIAKAADDSQHMLLLAFEVEDTGVGIAVEDQARIFEAFVQAGQPAAQQKGTGLGLSITRQLVELMGGTIHVDSTLGKGSIFRAEVPVERARQSEVMTPRTDRGRVTGLEPDQPEYRILVVEDQMENSSILERLLRKVGFVVQVAADGAQGVEMYLSWRPHFVWMDLHMPVMDGVEAARRIRALGGGRDVKIVAASASVLAHERTEALAAGMDDLIGKPYRLAEVLDCMAKHLGVRYSRAEVVPAEPLNP